MPDGVEGEIHIRSPLVMLGYWRKPEATAETILPGRWLKTGDIGMIRDGLLYLSARRSDLILRGGENVYPAEIENCLEAHPAVRECVVLGVPHEELGQEVMAIVVPRDGQAADPDELRDVHRRAPRRVQGAVACGTSAPNRSPATPPARSSATSSSAPPTPASSRSER